MSAQPDMFGHRDPAIGLSVRLVRNGAGRCHDDVYELAPGRGHHAYELLCSTCGRHRGWLPKAAADFIHKIIDKFGRPTESIVIRNL